MIIPEGEILYNGMFGSKLYGLATPDSDDDYKGVYAPSYKNLIFNEYKDSIEKQTPERDETYYAVTKFIRILAKNDTVSNDMLFSDPDKFGKTVTPLWLQFRDYRQDVLCKNCRSLLGYVKTQSSKYGHKVQRSKELDNLIVTMKAYSKQSNKIKDTQLPEHVVKSEYKFIKFVPEKGDIKEHLDILGKMYQTDATIEWTLTQLLSAQKSYGKRVDKAKMSGGDFKALSHSYRVLLQLEELINTRDLIFTLVYADKIMPMKLGALSQEDSMNIIDEAYDRVMEKLENSDLPEYNDMTRFKDAVMNYYL